MKRSPEEIRVRVRAIVAARTDMFGVQITRLLSLLSFDDAKEFLKPEATKEEWEVIEFQSISKEAHEYLPFAWDKANNRRGLSASRSVDHFRGLLWLDGIDKVDELMDELYQFYGKPNLVFVSELYDFPWQDHDDGLWGNDETDNIPVILRDKTIEAARDAAIKHRNKLDMSTSASDE